MSNRLQVLIAHTNATQRAVLVQALRELGHSLIAECETAAMLIQRAGEDEPDLIVTGIDLLDGDGIAALLEITNFLTIPAIIVTNRTSLHLVEEAMLDHVMAYLLEPVEREEIKPTVHLVLRRFEQFQELQAEVQNLKQALADRRLIERAKGILMRNLDVDEEAAYTRLRRLATDQRRRLIEVAAEVLGEDAATSE